ncbi:MAG TPA: hypothetical protein VG722_06120 [Tepidisphaeraceae bacterium]|nr:hypothetical protein [Tepidisphaeraceae bacterium]
MRRCKSRLLVKWIGWFSTGANVELLLMKYTQYFISIRARSDRAIIRDEWIEQAMRHPVKEVIQSDGRIRRWAKINEMDGRYLRVILLEDGQTIHNAFFDRSFKP